MPVSTAMPTLVFMKLTDVQQHCLLIYYTTFLSNQSKDVESTDIGIYVTNEAWPSLHQIHKSGSC